MSSNLATKPKSEITKITNHANPCYFLTIDSIVGGHPNRVHGTFFRHKSGRISNKAIVPVLNSETQVRLTGDMGVSHLNVVVRDLQDKEREIRYFFQSDQVNALQTSFAFLWNKGKYEIYKGNSPVHMDIVETGSATAYTIRSNV